MRRNAMVVQEGSIPLVQGVAAPSQTSDFAKCTAIKRRMNLERFCLHIVIMRKFLVCFMSWGVPELGVPKNSWSIMENPMKIHYTG